MNAITARIGLNSSDYLRDLQTTRQATVQAQQSMTNAARQQASAVRNTAAAHRQMGGSSARAAGDLINLATQSSGACNELNVLTHTLGLPIAGAIGLTVAIGVAEQLHEAIDKVIEANQEARLVMAKPVALAVAAGPEASRKAFDEKTEAINKLQNSRGFMARVGANIAGAAAAAGGDKVLGFFTGDDKQLKRGSKAVTNSLEIQKQLEADRVELITKSAAHIRHETADREKATHSSALELELLNRQATTREKIAKIRMEAPTGQRGALIEREESEGRIKDEHMKRAAAMKADELYLERRLTEIKKEGFHIEEESARSRLMTAKSALNQAITSEDKSAAKNRVAEAQLDYDLAVRAGRELRAQLKLQREIADMIAAPQDKQRAQLKGDRELLKERLKHARPDERPKIEIELAVNATQLRALAQEVKEKARRIADSIGVANTGRGEGEHIREMREKIDRGVSAYNEDKKNPEIDPETIAAARAQLTTLWHTYLDLTEARARSVQFAKNDAQLLQMQLDHNPIMAQALRTQLDFREKIRQATKDGNTELAAQLQKQMQLTLQLQAQQLLMKRDSQAEFSISELATEGRGGTRSKARRALEEERLGRQRGLAGDKDGALRHFDRANEIKKGIGALNFADRQTAKELASALDTAQVLKDIKTATEKFSFKML